MNELLHLENQDAAKKLAAEVGVRLKEILNDPILSVEASMAGTKISDLPL